MGATFWRETAPKPITTTTTMSRGFSSHHIITIYLYLTCLLSSTLCSLMPSNISSTPARFNDTFMADINNRRVIEYEGLILSCLSKITAQTEKCVQTFNKSFEEHRAWMRQLELELEEPDEKVRRYCCMQADFKDCWTLAIRMGCSELESRLTKWLPLQVLQDLRTDERCQNYVLYPHKCKENSFSLWQILAFLLAVPFVAFSAILLTIAAFRPDMVAYKSLKILRTNQEMDI